MVVVQFGQLGVQFDCLGDFRGAQFVYLFMVCTVCLIVFDCGYITWLIVLV